MLREEISTTLKREPWLRNRADFMPPYRFRALTDRIAERFLERGKQQVNMWWWWERLREPWCGYVPRNSLRVLTELLDPEAQYWFLASNQQKKWLLDATGAAIIYLVADLERLSEYYVVERKLRWLIGENHHNVVFASGQPVANRLAAVHEREPGTNFRRSDE